MIDIPETEQEIEERFEKKEIRKQVESENRKLEGNVELTGKRLENWEFLDKMRDEKLVTLNLWGNKIKSISELKRFKNLRELHMRENEISVC
jgi:Leucine-rich repeat (LRR) protein